MASPRKLSSSQTDALAALVKGELAYTVAGYSTSLDSIKYFASTTIYVLTSLGYCETTGTGLRRVARITEAGRLAHAQLQQEACDQ